jgi:hypothetical protein
MRRGEHVFVRARRYLQRVSTITRGNAAEAAVLNALIRADLIVLVPFGDGAPYDLVVDSGSALDRVLMIPVDGCARLRAYLRLRPPRNNQQRRIRFADDYAFELWARSLARTSV